MVSGHKSNRQNKYLNYVRTQVKIAKDGFELCPDTSQNRKIWIYLSGHKSEIRQNIVLCPFVDPAKIWINYVRTQVKKAKYKI